MNHHFHSPIFIVKLTHKNKEGIIMRKLVLITVLLHITFSICMEEKLVPTKKEKEIFHKKFFSPELTKALLATLLTEPWKQYAPRVLKENVTATNTKEFEEFVAKQSNLQKDLLRRMEQESLETHGLEIISYELKDDPIWYYKEKYFKQWLQDSITSKPDPIFNSIPQAEQKTFVRTVVKQYLEYVPYETYSNMGVYNGVRYNRIGKSNSIVRKKTVEVEQLKFLDLTQSAK